MMVSRIWCQIRSSKQRYPFATELRPIWMLRCRLGGKYWQEYPRKGHVCALLLGINNITHLRFKTYPERLGSYANLLCTYRESTPLFLLSVNKGAPQNKALSSSTPVPPYKHISTPSFVCLRKYLFTGIGKGSCILKQLRST